jgi:hypothetical protein
MSIYTIAFIAVTLLVLIGLALFGLLIMKIDKWVDRKERLGKESLYKDKSKTQKPDFQDNK